VAHDYLGFVREELCGRASPAYPPVVRLANIVFSGTDEQTTAQFAESSAGWLARLVASHASEAITIVGPAPCPVERIKNRWRWHLVLKSASQAALSRVGHYFLRHLVVPGAGDLRVTLDRDPVALL
jgi:primosomal protein N' (replication factor Y)